MDTLIKALAYNKMVRIYACDTTELVEYARKIHDCHPTSAAALGRTITGTLLSASLYDGDQTVSVTIDGGGPVGKVNAMANAKGMVNGYIDNPHVYLTREDHHLDVAKAVGKEGFMSITKDLQLKQLYTSSSPIVSGEIAEDFTYYYATSEQIPTSVGLAVLVGKENKVINSGGFILQLLPNTSEEVVNTIENLIKKMPPIHEQLLDGKTPQDIIDYLSNGKYELLNEMPLKFYCSCNRESYYKALSTLPITDLEELLNDDVTTITCYRCKTQYTYTKTEVQNIIDQKIAIQDNKNE